MEKFFIRLARGNGKTAFITEVMENIIQLKREGTNMIKFEQTSVHNMYQAIRGMRNPHESWARSDSFMQYDDNYREFGPKIGKTDIELARQLIKGGSEHRKFLRQIFVSVNITAPEYWWKEYATYKVGTCENSTSTMHRIMKKKFTEDMFSWDKCYITDWKLMTLANLNFLRERWIETKDKKDWYALIQMLPMSFNYFRSCTMNYENLYSMYCQRKNHKLDEWHDFCDWCEGLPYFKEFFLD